MRFGITLLRDVVGEHKSTHESSSDYFELSPHKGRMWGTIGFSIICRRPEYPT